MSKKRKFLFAIDLDGTLLSNSQTGKISNVSIKAINRARKAGHIVCLITGRPWSATEKTYKSLKLNTIVGNYNGAHIHNPTDYSFIPYISYLNLNEVMYILGDKKLKAASCNVAIEGPGWVQISKRDANLEHVFGFNNAKKFRVGINIEKLPLKPTGVLFDTKEGVNVLELRDYLKRRYGDLAEFASWSKGEGLTPVFDITSLGSNKSKAISLMSRYYSVDIDNVVAFGDGYNDVSMFGVAGISVAMKNSEYDVKEEASVISNHTNKEGGVGHYINYLLDHEEKETARVKEIRDRKFMAKPLAKTAEVDV